jgi:hypothetical protein
MRPNHLFLYAVCGVLVTALPALSDPPAPPGTAEMWECPQAGGTTLYVNRERPGCRAIELKPLSTVPPFIGLPNEPQVPGAALGRLSDPPQIDWYANAPGSERAGRVPDWAKDWYAGLASPGSVREEICALYAEWIRLNERTRGGFFFGSDPSYGGDPTGRNLRLPSYSFYDNARWVALARLFGTGFVPVGCP